MINDWPPTPPEGYEILQWKSWHDTKVKRVDLVYNPATGGWDKPKALRYYGLGAVSNYWFVARKKE